jgi:2-dehydro-3-deoxyphosphogluconate aldolase/(4S)-4-hydroxy-2-oxoglutarate aldolase
MTNLKMVFPEINLIPSGGLSLETAAEFIRCGACAVSGARNFFDYEKVQQSGLEWITRQIETYISLVAQAKADAPPLP